MTPAQRRGLDVAGFLTPAVYHYACVAIASGNPGACAALSGLTLRIPGARSLAWNCRQRYDEAAFARALIRRDPGAAAVCADFLRGQFGIADPSKIRALCAGVFRGGARSDENLCREVAAASGREATELRLRGCYGALAIYRGEKTHCESLAGQDNLESDQALCRAVRAFRRAGAGGPGACGGEPLCRALLGAGPGACAPYAASAKKIFAARRRAAEPAPVPGPSGAPVTSLADDVLPQLPDFPDAPRAAPAAGPAGDFPAARRDAYPSFADGLLRPPRRYDAEKNFSAADREKLALALHAAHHLADVNIAYQEGYRPVTARNEGAEVRFAKLSLRESPPAADKPVFLSYVIDARTGRFQLVRLGWLRRGAKPPAPLFDAPAATWVFHPGAETSWTLNAAPSVYNDAGMFAASFPDAARLAAGETRSFYGAEPGAEPRRAPRPVCPPRAP